ncbi:hypothetical protein BC938DRAFT_476169 [Jimgerdemannia flammicorona]|uniref:Anaphase-promoting complex subunit 2 n=1 Tax=Jimgerdemannia flammicorona TaxID=994334 RepID=A0A433QQV6_9FUNG|nr:hypothetical protein BC938DRAFT_476169 [Jimgerdemannia flammicorona]
MTSSTVIYLYHVGPGHEANACTFVPKQDRTMTIRTAWNNAYQTLNGGTQGVAGLLNVAKAWRNVTTALNPATLETMQLEGLQEDLLGNVQVLREAQLVGRIVEWYLDSVLGYVSATYGPRFEAWALEFKRQEDTPEDLPEWVYYTFGDVVNTLYDNFKMCERPLVLIQASPEIFITYTRQYQSLIQSLLPPSFNQIAIHFFRTTFKSFEHLYRLQRRTGHPTADLFSPSLPMKGRALRNLSHTHFINNDHAVMDLFVTDQGVEAEPMDRDDEDDEDEDEDEDDDDDDDEITESDGQDDEEGATVVKDLVTRVRAFVLLCTRMDALGLVVRTEGIFTEILYGEIEEKVRRGFCGRFDEPALLGRGLRWMRGVVLAWLSLVICQESGGANMSEKWDSFLQWKTRLEYHLYKTFGELRISELFDIIVEYPDSTCAIDELKECMSKTDQKQQLLESLRNALQRRLLHPGANTTDILSHYISCIKCLRILDPSRVLLEHVTSPIRTYLRQESLLVPSHISVSGTVNFDVYTAWDDLRMLHRTRDDTIRCIVTILVDDGRNELLEDLAGEPIQLADDDVEDFNDDNWMPDPVDAGPNYKSTSKHSADIISMLVNIYDTKDVFIKEFQVLLADRLMAVADYDTEREVRNLELLKLRFGESSFQTCEVMIKDIADSKRIDAHVHKDKEFPNNAPLHSIVLSRLFWPSFRAEEMQVPEPFQKWMSDYEKSFEVLKPARKLSWLPHLGNVKLELQLQDRTLEFNVSPVHASIIHCFEEKDTLTIGELAETLKMPPAQVKRRMGFWVSQGILKEDGKDTYVLLETAEAAATTADPTDATDGEASSSALQSAQEKEAEEMRIYWLFVQNFLTNFGPQSLDKIQGMMTMFVQSPTQYSRSAEELRAFLALMIRENRLEFGGGMYKLK